METARTLHAERYLLLRRQLNDLQKVRGRITLQELLGHFDTVWRLLHEVHASLTARAKSEVPEIDVDHMDFALLAQVIHEGQDKDCLCGWCGASIPAGAPDCSFCAGPLGSAKFEGLISPNMYRKLSDERPVWDIWFGGPFWNWTKKSRPFEAHQKAKLQKKEAAAKTAAQSVSDLPEIKPASTKSQLPGPHGVKRRRKKERTRKSRMSKSAEKLASWGRRAYACTKFPYAEDSVRRFDARTLRTILSAIPDMPKVNWSGLKIGEMRDLIMKYQPQHPIEPPPLPVGQLPKFDLEPPLS